MACKVLNILDAIRDYGEEAVKKGISTFRCSLNPEIESFLLERAVDFAKKKISITYLVVNDEEKIVAYFTLAHKPTLIPVDGLSQTMQKKLSRFAIFNVEDRKYNASAFLIAQLGKNTEIGKESCPAGSVLMGIVLDILRDVQHRIGGGIVFLECEDNDLLLKFYTDRAFCKSPFEGTFQGFRRQFASSAPRRSLLRREALGAKFSERTKSDRSDFCKRLVPISKHTEGVFLRKASLIISY